MILAVQKEYEAGYPRGHPEQAETFWIPPLPHIYIRRWAVLAEELRWSHERESETHLRHHWWESIIWNVMRWVFNFLINTVSFK